MPKSVILTTAVMGSPSYMAPEAFQAAVAADHRADIFSLGVVAYELFIGHRPFDGEALPVLMHQICQIDPVPPAEADPDCPREIHDLIMKMLVKPKEDRAQSADAVVADLDRFLGPEAAAPA